MTTSTSATTRQQARAQACGEYARLNDEDSGFQAAFETAAGAAGRIAVLSRAVEASDRLADLRPACGGRTRDVHRDQNRWREQAALCRAAIRVEHARSAAAERGLELPDPLGLPRATYIPRDSAAVVMAVFAEAYEQLAGWTPPQRGAADPAAEPGTR
ncbi:hypothetical protein L3Q65_00880 (plasmid) [Amycolatopsis sp. FU40]|uniref:hypothetical protein n=1 Tax=Amycolatopsis sp. FU40 TaxID=2914159 RepID=UPI001F1C2B15|nr:hypothetical protein [Amycolatopsis sp. FU40]UKD50879.1 hypothetical protein L3Q65_00880 [Amycolatopsis sp. FU40]